MSDLEKDFEEVAEKINTKIKEAAEALREANRLAGSTGMCGLIYTQWTRDDLEWDNKKMSRNEIDVKCKEQEERCHHIDVSPLEDALNDAGWSTSSSYC